MEKGTEKKSSVKKKSEKKEQKPLKIFVLDTETRALGGKIFKIGLFSRDENGKPEYESDTNFKKIKQILLASSITYDVHIYIHVLDFDFSKIVKDLKFQLKFLPSLFINGRTVKIESSSFPDKNGKQNNLTFHDSFSLFPKSLDQLCNDFDVKDKKIDLIEHLKDSEYAVYKSNGKLNETATKRNYFKLVSPDDELLNEYLKYDCMSLYEILMKAIEISGLETKTFTDCPTTASLSMKIFNTLFEEQFDHATSTIFFGKNQMVEWFLREGYYGGRTEIFIPRLKKGGYYLDKNSMYPHCMRNYTFPVGEFREYTGVMAQSNFELFCFDGIGGGMVEAEVNIPYMKYPVLPYKCPEKKKLIFPYGKIRGVWTFHELKFAMDRGVKVTKVHKTVYFPVMSQIFIGFVNHFEKVKEENTEAVKGSGVNSQGKKVNKSLREWSKLILNSLYGKFASKRERDSYVSIEEIEEAIKKLNRKKNQDYYKKQIEFFNDVLEQGGVEAEREWLKKEDSGFVPHHFYHTELEEEVFKYHTYLEAKYIQVQISAYVTSYARMELYEAIEWIDKNGGEVYYCDTDSIITDIMLPAEMVHKTEFGKWDKEHEIMTANFVQEKLYALQNEKGEEVKKGKGFPKEIINDLTMQDYEEFLYHHQYRDVEKIQLVTADMEIEVRPNFLEALKMDKDFNEIKNLEKAINLRNIKQKRKINYEDNSSEPWYYEHCQPQRIEEMEKVLEEETREEVENMLNELTLEKCLEQYGKIKIPEKEEYYSLYQKLKAKTKKKFFGKKGTDLFNWCLFYESAPDSLFEDLNLN